MNVSVIMPVYSETESVRQTARAVAELLGPDLLEIILIVSPRSSAESLAVCNDVATTMPVVHLIMQSDKPGYGQAYREALPGARGTAMLFLDADGEFDLRSIKPMCMAMAAGADVVLASRWIPGGGVEGYGWSTFLANRAFQIFLRALYGTPLHDLTFGYKMSAAHVVRTIPWEGTMHEFAMENTLKPIRFGYRVVEVPSFWRKRREGKSKNKGLLWRLQRYLPLAMSIRFGPAPPGTPAYAARHVPPVR